MSKNQTRLQQLQNQQQRVQQIQRRFKRLFLRSLGIWILAYSIAAIHVLPPLEPLVHIALFMPVAGFILAVCHWLAGRRGDQFADGAD